MTSESSRTRNRINEIINQAGHHAADHVRRNPDQTRRETQAAIAKHRAGTLTAEDALDILADVGATGRLTPDKQENLAAFRAMDTIPEEHMPAFIDLLLTGHYTTFYAALNSGADMTKADIQIYTATEKAAVQLILDKYPHWPVITPHGWTADAKLSHADAAKLWIQGIGTSPSSWHSIGDELCTMARKAYRHQQHADPLPWFDPYEMTVNETMRAKGYNIINIGDIQPGLPWEVISSILNPRWLHLAATAEGLPGLSPANLTRMALYPLLDRALADGIERYDKPGHNDNSGYNYHIDAHDGTPLEYYGDTRFLLEAEIDRPMNHLRAIFGRTLTELMQYTNLGHPESPAQLAQEIVLALTPLTAMAQWARQAQEKPSPRRGGVQWQDGTATAWRTAALTTQEWTSPGQITETVNAMRDDATDIFSNSDEARKAMKRRNVHSMCELRADRQGGPNHPHAALLRQLHTCLDYAHQTVQPIIDGPYSMTIPPENDLEYAAERSTLGDSLPTGLEGQLGTRAVCLYDRAMRHLAHAGYIHAHLAAGIGLSS